LLALKLGVSTTTTTRRGSYSSLISGADADKSTRMMAFANTEDPWIDYLIISGLGGCYATPIIQFFSRRKIQNQDWPSASPRLNLRLGGYSIWSAILQSHFHIISTSRLMSWTTFQPHGSSSTIEDFSKQYSRTLKNYLERLQDYSNYYSRLQRVRGLVGHSTRYPYE
jgi:hypothetical protein